MAYADYRLCEVCQEKAFYDADLSYDFKEYPDTGLYNVGAWAVLCRDCIKTHRVVILPADGVRAVDGGQQ